LVVLTTTTGYAGDFVNLGCQYECLPANGGGCLAQGRIAGNIINGFLGVIPAIFRGANLRLSQVASCVLYILPGISHIITRRLQLFNGCAGIDILEFAHRFTLGPERLAEINLRFFQRFGDTASYHQHQEQKY
jgi:hypothetical protein